MCRVNAISNISFSVSDYCYFFFLVWICFLFCIRNEFFEFFFFNKTKWEIYFMFILHVMWLGNLCANFKFVELWTMVIIWGTYRSTYHELMTAYTIRSFDVLLRICKLTKLMGACAHICVYNFVRLTICFKTTKWIKSSTANHPQIIIRKYTTPNMAMFIVSS